MNNKTNYPSLNGQVVFITGGATGIGAAMVEAFVLQGAQVAFIDFDQDAGIGLVTSLEEETGHRPLFIPVDVTNINALQNSIETAVSHFGSLGVLINNVANDTRHNPHDVTEGYWNNCMAVNLDASFFAAQTAYKFMSEQQRGSIINFSSINALLGPSNMPGYVTAKAGLIGMGKALARDYGEAGVRVNTILPGWAVTERQLELWLTPEAEQEWMQQVCIKKRLLPQDVANLALFLASDDSSMITGQSLTIDGGRT